MIRSLVVALLLVHAGLILYGASIHSTTIDEAGHLASGVHNWQTGNYDAYRVNPPLYRLLATLPLQLTDYEPVPDSFGIVSNPLFRSEAELGQAFSQTNLGIWPKLLFRARLAGAAWSCLGALLILHLGRQIGGNVGGWVPFLIWIFEPNVIANSSILTPDLPAAVAGLLAIVGFRWYLSEPDYTTAAVAGVLLAVALLSKFTLLILLPVCLVLLLFSQPIAGYRRPRLRRLGHAAACLGTMLILIHLAYECTRSGMTFGEPEFISDWFTGQPSDPASRTGQAAGNRFRGTWLERLPMPVPGDYLIGMDVQRYDFEHGPSKFPSYLAGRWREGGWWYFYLAAMLVKIPTGFLVLMLGGIAATLFSRRVSRRDKACVLLPGLAILGLVSSQTGFTVFFRYALPCLPFLMVGSARLWSAVGNRWWRGLIVVLLAWGIGSHLRAYPHSHSYFVEAVGGPENGSDWLIDCNIDWGQDVWLLRDWERANPGLPMRYELFTWQSLALSGLSGKKCVWEREEGPARVAVSVDRIQRMRLSNHNLERYDRLKAMTPVARIGYSIRIYEIDFREWPK